MRRNAMLCDETQRNAMKRNPQRDEMNAVRDLVLQEPADFVTPTLPPPAPTQVLIIPPALGERASP